MGYPRLILKGGGITGEVPRSWIEKPIENRPVKFEIFKNLK
jgi:hypothetical protein